MATYQQRIALKGTESTISHFTNLLRGLKDLFGINSAEVITNSIQHWRENGYKTLSDKHLSLNLVTKYFSDEVSLYNTRVFHLQLLTSTETMSRITSDVDRLKRDSTLKSAIEMYGIGRFSRGIADFQLAALILVLEYYKLSSPMKSSKAYSDLTISQKPPLPIAQSLVSKSYLLQESKRNPLSMQKESNTIVGSLVNGNTNEGNQNNIPSHVRDLNQNRISVEQKAKPSIYEPRSIRGQSCSDYSRREDKNLEDKDVCSNKHLVSWRARIREQQLADNRKLNDTIRSTLSCSRDATPVRNFELEEKIKTFRNWRCNTPSSNSTNTNSWRNPGSSLDNNSQRALTNNVRECVSSNQNDSNEINDKRSPMKHLINYDNVTTSKWTPVHQIDIRKRAFGLSSNATTYNKAEGICNGNNSSYSKMSDDKENSYTHIKEKGSPAIKRRFELDLNNNYNIEKNRQASEPPKTLPKLDSTNVSPVSITPPEKISVPFTLNINLDIAKDQVLSIKERKARSERAMTGYLMVDPPDIRCVPGLTEKPLSTGDRLRLGIDCDEVYPKIVLGNGVTLRKKSYLKDIGITHILNAAESRGVNVGKEYFGDEFQYMGLKIEDTPQTQICRYFEKVAEFIGQALSSGNKVFVNCVFGRSRSTTCVVAYLMICQEWTLQSSLNHIRRHRPVQLNYGFIQQLVDLENKLDYIRNNQENKITVETNQCNNHSLRI